MRTVAMRTVATRTVAMRTAAMRTVAMRTVAMGSASITSYFGPIYLVSGIAPHLDYTTGEKKRAGSLA